MRAADSTASWRSSTYRTALRDWGQDRFGRRVGAMSVAEAGSVGGQDGLHVREYERDAKFSHEHEFVKVYQLSTPPDVCFLHRSAR